MTCPSKMLLAVCLIIQTTQPIHGAPTENLQPLFDRHKLPPGAEVSFSLNYLSTRQRFLERFFFDGAVAERRRDGDRMVKFADQTMDMGRALLAFASEARVLASKGYSTSGSDAVIRDILREFQRTESGPWEDLIYGRSVSGFFIRDSVERNNRHGVPDDWQIISDLDTTLYTDVHRGHPAMSNDQTIHLIVGWWAVTHWTSDPDNIAMARHLTNTVMQYLEDQRYYITLPDGNDVQGHRGPDMRLSAVEVTKLADEITDGDYFANGNVTFEIETNLGSVPLSLNLTDLEDALPAVTDIAEDILGDSSIVIGLPGYRKEITYKPYSKNLIFMTMAFEPDFNTAAFIKSAWESGHFPGLLLRSILFGVSPGTCLSADEMAEVTGAWQDYPAAGPSNQPLMDRWYSGDAWSTPPRGEGDGQTSFNGLDFLVFEPLLLLSGVLNTQDVERGHRENIIRFYAHVLQSEAGEDDVNAALARQALIGVDQMEKELLEQRISGIYHDVYNKDYRVIPGQIEDGLRWAGDFTGFRQYLVNQRAALLVVIISTLQQ